MSNLNPKDLEKILKAFANKRRIAILRLIRVKRGVTLGDIADEIKLSYKTTSKHLGILTNIGIVEREQQGFRASYTIASDLQESARKILNVI
jgi:DNA-binding transcriptional ArsR family regulator